MKDKDGDVWCDDCGNEFATVNYENEVLCTECFLETLREKNEFETFVTEHYVLDGEYLGSEDNIDEVLNQLLEFYEGNRS